MSVPFKYLPHEIFQKPRPAPAIRVYPAAPHEFFIPKPAEKPVTPPKPVTAIRARLWSQNPQTQKKKKKDPARPIGNVDPPAAGTHRPALRRRRHHLHLQPPPLRTSTTTDTKTQVIAPPILHDSSRRHSSAIPAAADFTVLAPPQPLIPTAVDPKRRCLHRVFFLWFPFVLSLSCSLLFFLINCLFP